MREREIFFPETDILVPPAVGQFLVMPFSSSQPDTPVTAMDEKTRESFTPYSRTFGQLGTVRSVEGQIQRQDPHEFKVGMSQDTEIPWDRHWTLWSLERGIKTEFAS
jgi:hypothetical protein